MVIYAEYLFLENFLSGFLLLHATARLRGLSPGGKRLVTGSILCGLYSFTLFWEIPGTLLSLLLKLAFSSLLMLLVFFLDKGIVTEVRTLSFWKSFGKVLLVFYLATFAMGGITIGLLYLLEIPGITYGGGIYIGNLAYWHVYLGMGLAWIGLLALASFLQGRLQKERTSVEVEISMGGKTVTMRGLVDTGNFLSDPLSGKPVFLVKEQALDAFPREDWEHRYRYIPYQSVGAPKGILTGLRPDDVVLTRKTDRLRTDVVLGIYEGDFPSGWDGEEYQILLHPSALGDLH